MKTWRKSSGAFLLLATLSCGPTTGAQAQQPAPPPTPSRPNWSAPASEAPQTGQQTPSVQKPGDESQAAQDKTPRIVSTTGLVHLVATVTDRRHNFVTDLEQSDFKILEDNTAQDIRFFGRETDLPLRIAVLLDTSNSIRPRLPFEQDAAIDFLDSVIRRNKDMAFLMTFDNEPEVVQDYTGDLALLTSAIRRQRAGGGTALNDAIYRASEKLMSPPLPKGPNPEIRRVLVVISDGADTLSISGDKPHKMHVEGGDKVLQEFADQSGGRVFYPYKIEDLAQSFVDIGAELRSQYFIAYSPKNPTADGKYRKIEVQADRKGLAVRTRKGYYSVAPPSGGK